ncbi:MAG: hypothetical protein HZB42_06025 [Sphingobacteriales bacterium]|nr:hypothetical protein [Sphingobacteriales bacterium]
MKKTIPAIFCILFISISTELHELMRLPVLIEHYFQHRSDDPCLSFFEYLKIHYSDNHPDDNDDNDDTQLPFKSQDGIVHIDTAIPVSRQIIPKTDFGVSNVFIPHYAEKIPDNKSFPIFQPPEISAIHS